MRVVRHVFILVSLVVNGLAAETWSEIPPLPRGMAGHAAAITPRGVWIAGGSYWDGNRKLIAPEVQFRTHGEKAWRTLASLPHAYAHGGSACDGEALWLAGGLGPAGLLKTIQRVDLASGRVDIAGELPEPLLYGGAALHDGSLWLVGGTRSETDFSQASAAWWRFDLRTGALHHQPTPGPAWINPVVLALGGDLHVLPGGVWSVERKRLEPPTHAWIYRTASREWEQRRLPLDVPRGLMGIALDDRRALLAGGIALRDGAPALSVATWLYESGSGAWLPAPPLPIPLLAGALAREGRQLLLSGGEDAPRHRSPQVWQLSWPSSTRPAPLP